MIVALLLLGMSLTVNADPLVVYVDRETGDCSSPFNISSYTVQPGDGCFVSPSNGGTIVDVSKTPLLSVSSSVGIFYVNCSVNPPILYG